MAVEADSVSSVSASACHIGGPNSVSLRYFYVLPGEALENQEELKVFEKMDVETWQTLAEFIASKYLFMKMMF